MPGWASFRELARLEIIQRSEEGCDVAGFRERWEAAESQAELMTVYDDLQKLRTRSDFPYAEPSHLAGIRALRPGEPKR